MKKFQQSLDVPATKDPKLVALELLNDLANKAKALESKFHYSFSVNNPNMKYRLECINSLIDILNGGKQADAEALITARSFDCSERGYPIIKALVICGLPIESLTSIIPVNEIEEIFTSKVTACEATHPPGGPAFY